jgi:hypothetical protein
MHLVRRPLLRFVLTPPGATVLRQLVSRHSRCTHMHYPTSRTIKNLIACVFPAAAASAANTELAELRNLGGLSRFGPSGSFLRGFSPVVPPLNFCPRCNLHSWTSSVSRCCRISRGFLQVSDVDAHNLSPLGDFWPTTPVEPQKFRLRYRLQGEQRHQKAPQKLRRCRRLEASAYVNIHRGRPRRANFWWRTRTARRKQISGFTPSCGALRQRTWRAKRTVVTSATAVPPLSCVVFA